MAHPDPAQLRNVAVLGHRGSGKTSLVEAMLFAAKVTTRQGRVADGTTVADFDDEEQRRGMSISASLCHLTWNGVKVNLLDTPGEPSFQGDTLAALRAVDAVLMVVNAASGVEVQTERLWSRAAEAGLARAIAVNMLDRERADFDEVMGAITEMAPGAVPIQIPIGSEGGFQGVVNLVSMTATTYAGGDAHGTTGPIPDDLAAAAQSAREHLIDVVAEKDDALIEKYLEGEEITTEELIGAILAGVAEGGVHPVVCVAGDHGIGVDRLLDLLVEALPSPAAVAKWAALDPESGEATEVVLSGGRPGGGALLQDARRPVQRPHQPAPRLLRRPPRRQPGADRGRGQGADRPALHAPGQGARGAHRDRPWRHRCSRQAEGGRDRRCTHDGRLRRGLRADRPAAPAR